MYKRQSKKSVYAIRFEKASSAKHKLDKKIIRIEINMAFRSFIRAKNKNEHMPNISSPYRSMKNIFFACIFTSQDRRLQLLFDISSLLY